MRLGAFLYFLSSCFFVSFTDTVAQNINIKYVEFDDNKVVLHYDLVDSVVGRFFTVRLYSSKDNFLNPLEKVTGEVGFELRPGLNKKIIWNAKEELGGQFEGKVSLELRGRIFIPFISVEQINQYKVFKRLRKYDLTWRGGTPQNILNFDLYRGEQKVLTFPNIANVGHHEFQFPAHTKPDKNYRFKISDTKNKDDVVYTKPFRIKRKIPLFFVVMPPVAVATALVFLLNQETPDDGLPHGPRPN